MESIPTDPGDVTGVVEKVLAKRGLQAPAVYELAAYDIALVMQKMAHKYLDVDDLDEEGVEWYLGLVDHVVQVLLDRKIETTRRYVDLVPDTV